MLASAFEISNDIFRARVMKAQNFAEALDTLAEVILDMGFTQAAYAYMPVTPKLPNGEWLPLKLNVRQYPKNFEDGWQQFMRVDPYYRACFIGTLPVDWTEVQTADELSSIQRKACNYLKDFGLTRGISVPVHLPSHGFAIVSAVAHDTCVNWRVVQPQASEPLFRIAHVFTKAIHDLGYEDQIDTFRPIRLTKREQECMRWVSAGKTSSEIATILGCSMENVRLHVKNSISKLNATNRPQAVANAVHWSLI